MSVADRKIIAAGDLFLVKLASDHFFFTKSCARLAPYGTPKPGGAAICEKPLGIAPTPLSGGGVAQGILFGPLIQ